MMNEQKISSRARLLAFPAVGAALVGVSFIGRSGGSAQDATSGTPEASPVASPQAELQTEFTIQGGDIFYSVTELTAPADTDLEITLENIGVAEHDFVIEDTEFRTSILSPGTSETITVNLPAGEYTYYCSVPGHRAAGMEGTLTIVEVTVEPETEDVGAAKASIRGGDIYFSVKEFSIPADTDVEITFSNEGVSQHDFVIENTEFRTSLLNGGGVETITVNLPAGEYTYYCSVPGHRPAGMEGTLTVA
jgi:uncharacterized cupredoxin-like copper-binding protein